MQSLQGGNKQSDNGTLQSDSTHATILPPDHPPPLAPLAEDQVHVHRPLDQEKPSFGDRVGPTFAESRPLSAFSDDRPPSSAGISCNPPLAGDHMLGPPTPLLINKHHQIVYGIQDEPSPVFGRPPKDTPADKRRPAKNRPHSRTDFLDYRQQVPSERERSRLEIPSVEDSINRDPSGPLEGAGPHDRLSSSPDEVYSELRYSPDSTTPSNSTPSPRSCRPYIRPHCVPR